MGGNTSGATMGKGQKYPTMSGGDVAINALAQMGAYKPGLIPALINGLGTAYIQNKQAQQQNAYAQEEEAQRRGSQSALLQAQGGINPQFLEALSGGDAETIKRAMELGYNTSGANVTDQMLGRIGVDPMVEGAVPSQQYQNALLNTMYGFEEKQPLMRKQTLEGDILEGTKAGEIAGTNAENEAKTKYAVPMAGAKYQGQNLINTGRGLQNQGIGLRNQGTAKRNALIGQQRPTGGGRGAKPTTQSQLQANQFAQVLQGIERKHQDPKEFRANAYKALDMTNAPMEVKMRAKTNIDNMAIMKQQIQAVTGGGGGGAKPQAKKKKGLGIGW